MHGFTWNRSQKILDFVEGTTDYYTCSWPHVDGAVYCAGLFDHMHAHSVVPAGSDPGEKTTLTNAWSSKSKASSSHGVAFKRNKNSDALGANGNNAAVGANGKNAAAAGTNGSNAAAGPIGLYGEAAMDGSAVNGGDCAGGRDGAGGGRDGAGNGNGSGFDMSPTATPWGRNTHGHAGGEGGGGCDTHEYRKGRTQYQGLRVIPVYDDDGTAITHAGALDNWFTSTVSTDGAEASNQGTSNELRFSVVPGAKLTVDARDALIGYTQTTHLEPITLIPERRTANGELASNELCSVSLEQTVRFSKRRAKLRILPQLDDGRPCCAALVNVSLNQVPVPRDTWEKNSEEAENWLRVETPGRLPDPLVPLRVQLATGATVVSAHLGLAETYSSPRRQPVLVDMGAPAEDMCSMQEYSSRIRMHAGGASELKLIVQRPAVTVSVRAVYSDGSPILAVKRDSDTNDLVPCDEVMETWHGEHGWFAEKLNVDAPAQITPTNGGGDIAVREPTACFTVASALRGYALRCPNEASPEMVLIKDKCRWPQDGWETPPGCTVTFVKQPARCVLEIVDEDGMPHDSFVTSATLGALVLFDDDSPTVPSSSTEIELDVPGRSPDIDWPLVVTLSRGVSLIGSVVSVDATAVSDAENNNAPGDSETPPATVRVHLRSGSTTVARLVMRAPTAPVVVRPINAADGTEIRGPHGWLGAFLACSKLAGIDHVRRSEVEHELRVPARGAVVRLDSKACPTGYELVDEHEIDLIHPDHIWPSPAWETPPPVQIALCKLMAVITLTLADMDGNPLCESEAALVLDVVLHQPAGSDQEGSHHRVDVTVAWRDNESYEIIIPGWDPIVHWPVQVGLLDGTHAEEPGASLTLRSGQTTEGVVRTVVPKSQGVRVVLVKNAHAEHEDELELENEEPEHFSETIGGDGGGWLCAYDRVSFDPAPLELIGVSAGFDVRVTRTTTLNVSLELPGYDIVTSTLVLMPPSATSPNTMHKLLYCRKPAAVLVTVRFERTSNVAPDICVKSLLGGESVLPRAQWEGRAPVYRELDALGGLAAAPTEVRLKMCMSFRSFIFSQVH